MTTKTKKMKTQAEVQLEQRNDQKPDYEHYSKMDRLTIAEFALVLNGINPLLYEQHELRTLFKENRCYPALYDPIDDMTFSCALHNAYKNYLLLNQVEWGLKYKECPSYAITTGTKRLSSLISEAHEKNLPFPEEFLKLIDARNKAKAEIGKEATEKFSGSPKNSADVLDPRENKTLYNLIGALANLLWVAKGREGQKINQSTLIAEIREKYPNVFGLSERNLQHHLPEGLRSIKEHSYD